MLLLIAIKILLERLRFSGGSNILPGISPITLFIGLFCLNFCLSALINKTDMASIGVAAKNNIFPWFLTLFVSTEIRHTEDLKGIWYFMLWMVFVQVPFAIVQHFYFAKRSGADWDAVVGTFGGNYLTGGSSGTMAVFLVFCCLLAIALFRKKQLTRQMLAWVVLATLTTVGLAEVKIFFIILPIGLIMLFRSHILLNPIKTIAYGMMGVVLMLMVLLAYQQTYSNRSMKLNDPVSFINYVFIVESNPYFFNKKTRELSRVGAILMWKRYNHVSNHAFFVGHGPASSRESKTLGNGVEARKYPFTLTTSAASTILWDSGLFGYAMFMAILIAGSRQAFHFAKQAPPMESAILETIAVMLLLNLLLNLYNVDLIDSPTYQVLISFWIGYVLLCRKKILLSQKQKSLLSL